MPFTAVSVKLSTPGVYVPVNRAAVAGAAGITVSAPVLLAVELAEADAGAVDVAVAIRGVSAAATPTAFGFAIYTFAPYAAVITYPVFTVETVPLMVALLVTPGAVLVGTTKKESSACSSCISVVSDETCAVSAVVEAATSVCKTESWEVTPELCPFNELTWLLKLLFCIYKNPASPPTIRTTTIRTISVTSKPRDPRGFIPEYEAA